MYTDWNRAQKNAYFLIYKLEFHEDQIRIKRIPAI